MRCEGKAVISQPTLPVPVIHDVIFLSLGNEMHQLLIDLKQIFILSDQNGDLARYMSFQKRIQ